LRGKDGSKVVHSGWNRDGAAFLEICEQRTGIPSQVSEL